MTKDRLTQSLLAVIACALVAIAVRPYVQPQKVEAQAANPDGFYFEPGVTMFRASGGGQVPGKVAINLRTGNVWGFPTGNGDSYPSSPIDGKPFDSHPLLIGRYALNEATR